MKAIVLTHDQDRLFTQHTIATYETLWPSNDLVFLVPWNKKYPRELIEIFGEKKIIPVQTEKPFKKTIYSLLDHTSDEEWIYWLLDDNYLHRIDCGLANCATDWLLTSAPENVYGLTLFCGSYDHEHGILDSEDAYQHPPISLYKKRKITYQWRSQFWRAKVLRKLFVCLDEPSYAKEMDHMLL